MTVPCPYCGDPTPGLLAGCDQADCRRRDLDADQQHTRNEDQ